MNVYIKYKYMWSLKVETKLFAVNVCIGNVQTHKKVVQRLCRFGNLGLGPAITEIP